MRVSSLCILRLAAPLSFSTALRLTCLSLVEHVGLSIRTKILLEDVGK
jgi:hypothetical protein